MQRYLCIHGHFYQPPRENPWLEAVELQDSAYPHHDWNERIHEECYAPNARSRILDDRGRILRITNNYAHISFNFGPTLLSWMEQNAEETYRAILDADRKSRELYGGHGSAIAQAYNHVIMPLANRRDKRCQIAWGIRDFEHRFGRRPEGMWLPETAVDVETLELLAEADIRYTILEPGQARRVRPPGGKRWRSVSGGKIDPTMAYEMRLPSGNSIALFFYDGPVSRAIAFERLLDNGESLLQRTLQRFDDRRGGPQLVHVATDGETYGHHHRYGEMALAYALERIASSGRATLTNYGQYLERHPPTHLVEIHENTSWSCAHGVERWRGDCGCGSTGQADWNQAWRAPLREALDWLRDRVAEPYERKAGELLRDPWAARADYIDVILDRTDGRRNDFLARHALRELSPGERVTVWKLLEMERHSMHAYTSCGWFFDELSGIETVQVIRYAGRVVQLAREVLGEDVEPEFLDRLERAKSNKPEYGDGRQIYDKLVRPSTVTLRRAGAHYAVSLLFDSYGDEEEIYGYRVQRRELDLLEQGRAKLATGRIHVRSVVTEEEGEFGFATLHFGDHNLTGGIRPLGGEDEHHRMLDEVRAPFRGADLPQVVRLLDDHFGEHTYSLKTLFRDEQRAILKRILAATLEETAVAHRRLYDHHAPLMRFLGELGQSLPQAFRAAGEFALNDRLRQAIAAERMDVPLIRRLELDARQEGITLDEAGLGFALEKAIERDIERLRSDTADAELIGALVEEVELARSLSFGVDLWHVENRYYRMLHDTYPDRARRAAAGEQDAARWVERFRALGEALRIRVESDF